MTPAQIHLVQTSWQQLVPQAEVVAQLFYRRLFEIAPSLRSMFQHEISEQEQKLVAMLDTVVRNLHQTERLLPAVRSLGRRHVTYGVGAEHYTIVASALLWTLEQRLGELLDEPTRAAWIAAYTLLATTMQEAAMAGQVAVA